jgi:hypothetical protein
MFTCAELGRTGQGAVMCVSRCYPYCISLEDMNKSGKLKKGQPTTWEISGRICNDMLMARYLYTLFLLRVITGETLLSVALRMVIDLNSIL